MPNKIEQRILHILQQGQPTPAKNLGHGLFLKYTVKDGAPRFQIWRTGGDQTSEQEAITVINALKAALRQHHPHIPHLVRRSKFATHTTATETYHGCSFTWQPDPTGQPAALIMPTWHAISIKQPWLEAIINHGKDIENRYYPPPADIIGQRIALHASKTDDPYGRDAIEHMLDIQLPADHRLQRGAILATAVVTGFTRQSDSIWFQSDQFGWQLADVRPLDAPLICSGQRKLWPVPHPLAQHLSKIQIQTAEETA